MTAEGSRMVQREPQEPDVGTAEDWQRIEEALGYQGFDPERRERLWRDLDKIIRRAANAPPEVRTGNYHHALDALRRHTVRLFADLSPGGSFLPPPEGPVGVRGYLESRIKVCDPDALPAEGLNELDLWALAYLSQDILPYKQRQLLLASLVELISAVDKMKEALPRDRGGRGQDHLIRGLISDLAHLYNYLSGKKPGLSKYPPTHPKSGQPSGPFFRFVKACLIAFAPYRADVLKRGEGGWGGLPTYDNDARDDALGKVIQRVLSAARRHRAAVGNGQNPALK